MAFGFPPKYIDNLPLNILTPEQFLVLAVEAAKKRGWSINYLCKTGFIASSKVSFSSWGETITVKMEPGNVHLKSECNGSQLYDWGRNEENIDSFLVVIGELKDAFTPELYAEKLAELSPYLHSGEEDILSRPPQTIKEKGLDFLNIFKPQKGFFITPILIDINILVFILMALTGVNIFSPDGGSLVKWGANLRPLTLGGEWWRLITCCFVHIGVLHLVFNMYALLYIGLLLEPHLGKTRFLSAYILAGIVSSTASLYWNDLTISAGASGAIFGLYGVFLALLTTNIIEKHTRKALMWSIGIFVAFNLFAGLKEGIDMAAHVGGFLSGLIIGYAFVPSLKKPEHHVLKFATTGILTIAAVFGSFLLAGQTSNDWAVYEQGMKEFQVNEAQGLAFYRLPPGTPIEQQLYELNEAPQYWNRNLDLLKSFEKLDLPDAVILRNGQIEEYCKLRLRCLQLTSRAISEGTDEYNEEIGKCLQKVNQILSDLLGEQK